MAFYLGPVGGLVELPAPARGLDTSPVAPGGVLVGLDGTVHRHRTGRHRRTYPLAWEWLSGDQAAYIEAIELGLIKGPLRLLDPFRRNLASLQVSTGGSYDRSIAGWSAPEGGGIEWRTVATPPITNLLGCIRWTRTTTAAAQLAARDEQVPLITGQTVRISSWCRATAAIAVAIATDAHNVAGAITTATASPVTLSTSAWTELSTTYVPPSDRVTLSPRWVIAAGQAAGTVEITAVQIGFSSEPTTWVPGTGVPTVVPVELRDSYPLLGRRAITLTLRER